MLLTKAIWRAPLATAMLMTAQLGGDGFALAFIIPMTSLRQAVLPEVAFGRTAGLFSVVSGGATVAESILGGLLGGALGVRRTLALAVAGIAGARLFVFFRRCAIFEKCRGYSRRAVAKWISVCAVPAPNRKLWRRRLHLWLLPQTHMLN